MLGVLGNGRDLQSITINRDIVLKRQNVHMSIFVRHDAIVIGDRVAVSSGNGNLDRGNITSIQRIARLVNASVHTVVFGVGRVQDG